MDARSPKQGFMKKTKNYIREHIFKTFFSPFQSQHKKNNVEDENGQHKGVKFDFLSRMKSVLKFNCKKKNMEDPKKEVIDFEQADEEFLKSFLNTEDQNQKTNNKEKTFFSDIINDISFQTIPLETVSSQKNKKKSQNKNLSLDRGLNKNYSEKCEKNDTKNFSQKNAKYPKQPNKKQEWKRMLDSVWNLDQKIPQKLTMMEDFKNPRIKLTDLIEKMKRNSQTYNFIKFWSLRAEFLSKTRNHNSRKRKRNTFYETEKNLAEFISNKKKSKNDFSFAEYENSDTQSEKSDKQLIIEEKTKVFKIKKIIDAFEEKIDDNIIRKIKSKQFELEDPPTKKSKLDDESDKDSVSSFKKQEVHSLFAPKTEKEKIVNEIKDESESSQPKNNLFLFNKHEENTSKAPPTSFLFSPTTENSIPSLFKPIKTDNLFNNETSTMKNQTPLKEIDKKEIPLLSIPIKQTNLNNLPSETNMNKEKEKPLPLFSLTPKDSEGSLFKLFPVQSKLNSETHKEDQQNEDNKIKDKNEITSLTPIKSMEKNPNVEKKIEDSSISQKGEDTTPKTEEKIHFLSSLKNEDIKKENSDEPKVEDNPFLTKNFSNTPNLSDFLKSESKNLSVFPFGGSLIDNNNNNMNMTNQLQPNNVINNDMFIESNSPKLSPITPFDSKSPNNNSIHNTTNNNLISPFSFINGVQNKIDPTSPQATNAQNLTSTPLFGNNTGSTLFGLGQVNNNNINSNNGNGGNGNWGGGLFGNLLNNSNLANNNNLMSGINNAMSLVSNPSQENSLFANLGGNNLGVLGNLTQNSGVGNSKYNKKRKQRINE